jgi:hypothetical protein
MNIPDVIVADQISVGNEEPHGIIYKIRQAVTNNNILNFVQPSSNYNAAGNIDTLVKWDGSWLSGENQNAYILIDFKDRFIFPTHYSKKGYSGLCYAKNWILYGLNSTNGSPVEISRNTSVGSTYCGSASGCSSDNWGTFKINSPTRAFRYLKMMSLVSSCGTNNWYMTMKGFEVFGILSRDGRTPSSKETYCIKSCSVIIHLPAYAFVRLFSVYLSY